MLKKGIIGMLMIEITDLCSKDNTGTYSTSCMYFQKGPDTFKMHKPGLLEYVIWFMQDLCRINVSVNQSLVSAIILDIDIRMLAI